MSNETNSSRQQEIPAAKAKKPEEVGGLRKVPTADMSQRSAKASMKIKALAANLASQRMTAVPSQQKPKKPQPRSASMMMKNRKPGPTVATRKPLKVEAEQTHGGMWVKVLCIALVVVIVGLLGANYVLVHSPLTSKLANTSYSDSTVYAHLGGFFQPNAVIIKVTNTPGLAEREVPDFLVELAAATPESPVGGKFEVVTLGRQFFGGKYRIRGDDWAQFGEMGDESFEEKKIFLLERIFPGSGKDSLMRLASRKIPSQRLEYQEVVWNNLIRTFMTEEAIQEAEKKSAQEEAAWQRKQEERLRREMDGSSAP